MMSAESLLDAFDAAWAAVHRSQCDIPDINEFRLPGTSMEARQHLEDLIEIDLAFRWKLASGTMLSSNSVQNPPSLGEYRNLISRSESAGVFSAMLVAEAYRMSRENGHPATPAEFLPYAVDRELAIKLLCSINDELAEGQAAAEKQPSTAMRPAPLPDLPDFHVDGILGRGGKGIVYKARQISVRRMVAIKMIASAVQASGNDIKRLRNEAQILGNLRHPNIVTIYALEEHEFGCCLVMEYVDGRDLAFHQREGTFSIRDVAAHMRTVSRAIQSAHNQNVLHRDIKPSNILLDERGAIRVTDFGLSRSLNTSVGDDPLTATTEVVGTPGYISPEQARGNSRELDETADVYGIGATLYSLLVGRAPFIGTDVLSILQNVCEKEPTPPGMLVPAIPDDLQTICLKCLEKRPADRYSSAGSLADDLSRFLNNEPILARPVGTVRRSIRWTRRNPTLAALLGSVTILTLTLAVFLVLRGIENAAALTETTRRNNTLQQALNRETAASQEIYASRIRQAMLEYQANELGNVRQILQSLKLHHSNQNGPPWEWTYLSGLIDASVRRWDLPLEHSEWIGALAFSPDASLLAIGNSAPHFDDQERGNPGRITVVEIATGRVVRELTNVMSVTDMVFTTDSPRLIAVESDIGFREQTDHFGTASIRQWFVDSWTEAPVITTDHKFDCIHLTADSASLLAIDSKQLNRASLVAFNLNGSDSTRIFPTWQPLDDSAGFRATADDGQSRIFQVADAKLLTSRLTQNPALLIHGDRFRISVSAADTEFSKATVTIHQKPTGILLRTLDVPFVEAIAISPGEQKLAIATNRGEIRVWDTSSWGELTRLRGHLTHVRSLTFSPDEQYLASGDWDGTVRLWQLSRVPGRIDTGTSLRGVALEAFAVNSQGNVVSVVGGAPLQVFAPGHSTSLKTVAIAKAPPRIAPGRRTALDAKGELVALPSPEDDTVVEIRDAATGNLRAKLAAHQRRVSFMRIQQNRIATAAWQSSIFESPDPNDGEIRLSTLDGTPVFSACVPAARVYRLALSGDAELVAASVEQYDQAGQSSCSVHIWDVLSGRQIDEFSMSSWPLALEFHPSRNLLTAIDFDTGSFVIRDVSRSAFVEQMADFAPGIQDLAFSPNGLRLAGVSRRKLFLWNVQSRKQVLELPLNSFEADYIYNPQTRFTEDGRAIMANQPDGTVRIWGALSPGD